jgi:TolB-like protein/Tfp pilus assembly protein PilF
MENTSSLSQPVRFGLFEVDLRSGELRKQGVKIKLQEQPLQILAMLLEHPGQVVTREELRSRLWPADTFVDFDHSLNKAINKLREALGDSAENPRFIETLSHRGYRFLDFSTRTAAGASIAVLPFLNLSADPENELFADGMSEEIISALMQIKKLHVAARTSSFSFKGKHVDLRVIGEQLNVSTVLEGSVRRAGNHLRITAQLVNATDGYHLWAERYDREMKDIFEIQEEIARSIVRRLEVMLEGEHEPLVRGGTEDIEAFRLYLQGRSLFFKRGLRLPRALECFKQAVAQDRDYALAWAALADSYNLVGFYGLARPEACLPQAKDAAVRAVTLGPSQSETHASLALSYLFLDWDRSKAEQEFLHALELNPRNTQARIWYGMFYLEWLAGRFEEGISQGRNAAELDPLSGYTRAILACMCVQGNLDEAVQAAYAALQIEPDSFLGRWSLMTAFTSQGRFEEAASVGEEALTVSGRYPWMLASLARTYREMGKPADSEALYMELRWRAKREHVSPAVLGWAASAAGEQDEAIRYAREAHSIGDPVLVAAKFWPDFALLRADPRFDEILISRGWT